MLLNKLKKTYSAASLGGYFFAFDLALLQCGGGKDVGLGFAIFTANIFHV